uniref:Uncharacterized protein n=1 Tax=Rhizophora mucronata TaxID=61149 RepID=A0A2P2R3Q7_RHIMU
MSCSWLSVNQLAPALVCKPYTEASIELQGL